MSRPHPQAAVIPELAGPATEHESGAISYGQHELPRIGRMPLPSPEERAAAAVLPEQCVNCGGPPGGLLRSLSEISQRAGFPHSGCWWHGHTPPQLLTQLRQLTQAGAQQ
jgi:hypothetical protein